MLPFANHQYVNAKFSHFISKGINLCMISSRRFFVSDFFLIYGGPGTVFSKRLLISIWLTIVFSLIGDITPSFAQSYVATLKQYTHEDGLRNQKNSRVLQDSKGFIWVTSEFGLTRFDGHSFHWITKAKNGLQKRTVRYMLEDQGGFIWLLYAENLTQSLFAADLLDPISGEVLPVKEIPDIDVPFDWGNVIDLGSNDSRSLFFLTPHMLYVYEPQNGFQSITLPQALDPSWLWILPESQSVWIGNKTLEKWVRLNRNGEPEDQLICEDKSCMPLYMEENSDLWFMQLAPSRISQIIMRKDGQNQLLDEFKIPPFSQNSKYSPLPLKVKFRSADSTLWVKGKLGTENSIMVFRVGKGQIYQIDTAEPLYREIRNITEFNFDKNGDAWICAHSSLIHLQLKPSKFSKMLYSPPEAIGQPYSCRGIRKISKNQLWVNTYKGIRQIDLSSGDVSDIKQLSIDELRYKLDVNFPHVMEVDEEGDIWIGGYRLLRFRPVDSSVKVFSFGKNYKYEGYNSWIWSMLKDRQQKIWLGMRRGLAYVEGDSLKQFTQYNEHKHLTSSMVLQIFEDNAGVIWLATSTGLYQLHAEKGIVGYWGEYGTGNHYLPCHGVRYIYEEDSGIMWLATSGSGLIRWNRQTGDIMQFTSEDGLSSNILHSIYEDDFGHLWISSEYGLIQFDKENYQVKNYFEQDGISHNEFNRISHFQDENGRIYFGGINGITAFHPKDFYEKDSSQIPLHITEFKQFDTYTNQFEDKTSELLDFRSIIIEPYNPFFTIRFSLLDYFDDGKKQYSYTIDGMNETWITQEENYLRLARLPFGNYTLRIRGQARDGQLSSDELAIPIRVRRPFYLRYDILSLAVLGTFMLIIAFYKWRIYGLQKRKAELRKIVKQRTEDISKQNLQLQADKEIMEKQALELKSLDKLKSRFFANVSHELRTPLTLILGPVTSILKRKELSNKDESLLQAVKQNAQHLHRLVNELLDLSRLEASRMELAESSIVLYPLCEKLLSAFRPYAEQRGISLSKTFEADRHLQVKLDRNKFEAIFNNLMSNALKFTSKGGEVSVKLTEMDSYLQLSVSDTGAGIHPDDLPHIFERFYQSKQLDDPVQGGMGIGLALASEFARIMDGTLTVDSEKGKGSTFYFKFPLKTGSLKSRDEGVMEEEGEIHDQISPLVSPSQSDSSSKQTILLVEDNESLSKYIQMLLQDRWQILMANNGKDALDIMHELPDGSTIDLIISDIMMPEMDGFTFLQTLRANPMWRVIPVIMLTARVDSIDKLRALQTGVDDYITKPFDEDELLARVNNLLRNYQERLRYSAEASQMEDENALSREQEWLVKFEETVRKYIPDHELRMETLGEELAVSPRQLRRRLKKLTGLTPREYILEIRLQEARKFLEQGTYDSVKAVALTVGFKDVRYFSGKFRDRFGRLPSSFLE